jgi:hypothetical protein
MAQKLSSCPLTAETQVRSHVIAYEICEKQSDIALGQVFLQVIWFSPVSIIPPMLHTHPFIYHRRCLILAVDRAVKQRT